MEPTFIWCIPDQRYVTVAEVIAAHPHISFPIPFELPPSPHYVWVYEVLPPVPAEGHRLVALPPVTQDGVFSQAWAVEPLNEQELADAMQALRTQLLQAVTARRWEVETGGITLPGGVQIATTTQDQNRIATVISTAALGGVETVEFKAASGWATLTLDQVRGIAAAIAIHVQACFAAERAHHAAIDGLQTLQELQMYNVGLGWPGQGV